MTTDRFYTKRAYPKSGTIQLIDTTGHFNPLLLPEDQAERVCEALNIAERPQITPERLAEFVENVAPDPVFVPAPGPARGVYQAGFDHALFILIERFELGEGS